MDRVQASAAQSNPAHNRGSSALSITGRSGSVPSKLPASKVFSAEFWDQDWAHHSYAKFAPKGNGATARASQAVNVRDSLTTVVMPLLTCGINVTAIHPHQKSLLAKAGSQADASDLMSVLTSQHCT